MVIFLIFAAISILGLAGYLLQVLAVRSCTSPLTPGEASPLPRVLPPISILKPLKGLDDGLFDNLESFCNLDYPEYEIIFALQDYNDPAYKVARKIKEKFPLTDIAIVVERCNDGLNPKVNNLIPAYRQAGYEHILISDSNVRVDRDYLKATARHLNDPEVGLVSNMIRGVSGRSIGAILENLHLNSFILGSVCLLDKFLGMPCVVGKSMLMKKKDLEAIGGFIAVKDILAEDYVIGERIHRMGKKVVLSNYVINNVNEYWGVRRFINRHSRWGKIRWNIGGAKYLSELFGNAVFTACMPLLLLPPSALSVCFAAAVVSAKIACDAYIGKKVNADLNSLWYLLGPAKDILIGVIWFVPILSNMVVWRGNRYLIGRESRLYPCPEAGIWSWMPGVILSIKTRLAWSKS